MQFKLIENAVILQGFIIHFSDSSSGLYIHILYHFQSQKPEKNTSSIDLFEPYNMNNKKDSPNNL